MHVVAGIIVNSIGEILIAQRPLYKYKGGFWELPGGKVEPQETSYAALQRELSEELDIHILAAKAINTLHYQYPDYQVDLETWVVTEFSGKPHGKEKQPICWILPKLIKNFKFLEANRDMIAHMVKDAH